MGREDKNTSSLKEIFETCVGSNIGMTCIVAASFGASGCFINTGINMINDGNHPFVGSYLILQGLGIGIKVSCLSLDFLQLKKERAKSEPLPLSKSLE